MIMYRPIFMVKPNLFAPGTVNPRHKLLNGARGGGDFGYGSSLVRSPPVLHDYHAKHAADLLAKFLTCSRKSAHVRLDPQSHLNPRRKQPTFPGAEWLGRISLYSRLVSCKRCRACGDGVEVVWRFTGCAIALTRTVGSPGTTEITGVEVLTDSSQ